MRRVFFLVVAVMSMLVACGGESSDTTGATSGTVGEEERVEIADLAFNPETLTVAVGSTVTWVNSDPDLPHTSTSDEDLWDSGRLDEGGEFSFTFDEPGTFAYFCEVHPTMRGSIVVE